ncbi:MAG: thiolase family protein [Thermoplasmatota archaeon]
MASILGAATTPFGRRSESLLELLRQAGRAALADARIARPDRVIVACQNPEEFSGEANLAVKVVSELGLAGLPALRVESAPSSGASAVEAASALIDAGAAEHVLVVAGEKMTGHSSAEAGAILARMLDARERAYGLTLPALAALQCIAAMNAYGWSREDLSLVPVKAHRHGARNPIAQFRKEIDASDVTRSPSIAPPLHLLDCAPLTDGACALVVSHHGPVYIRGIGHATDLASWTDRRYDGWLHSFRASSEAADHAFTNAGVTRGDVDLIETHDAFSHLELVNLVDLRFFSASSAIRALRDGETSLGGRLPVNVSGGLKARGHPVGATGVAQLVELYLQLTGHAGARQVPGASLALAHNIGGFGNNVVVSILEAAS